MRHVVVDANVLVSFFVERNEKQRAAGKALLLSAEEGEITAVIPQFVLFEPGPRSSASRTSFGTVVWPLLVMVERMGDQIAQTVSPADEPGGLL